jgi:FtsH-binding integral membrane protein
MGLLTVWTLVESYTVGVVCASYSAQGAGDIVLQAFIITGVIFFGTCPAQ